MKQKLGNYIKILAFTVFLGAFSGLVIWCFLKAVAFGSALIWTKAGEFTGIPYITVLLCVLGGLAAGLLRRRYGDYPEELSVVLYKVKHEKHYDYHPMFVILLCAFIPLITGASVGPEAGLTGIIAALCYWIGDNVNYAGENAMLFSELGEAVTLGQLFHSPLFGIIAVEEEGDDQGNEGGRKIPRSTRLVLYVLSTTAGLLVMEALNRQFGAAMSGFPAFSEASFSSKDLLLLLLYIPVGMLLFLLYELFEKLTAKVAGKVPAVVREGFCGLIIGLAGLFFPMVIFSGEEQMAELMESFMSYTPLILLGICVLKLLMTAFCLNFGLKGGHFFPLIFACTCMGFCLTQFLFSGTPEHAAFAAAAITATVIGAQLQKPLAASLLLLLCFPFKILPWIFLCAVLGMAGGKALSGLMKGER